MIVLGISETHCATAAVLRDGAIVGCASEERFSRLKNDAGYPRLAIDALLRGALLAPEERRRLPAPRDRRAPGRTAPRALRDRPDRPGGHPHPLLRLDEPRDARSRVRAGVLRGAARRASARAHRPGSQG